MLISQSRRLGLLLAAIGPIGVISVLAELSHGQTASVLLALLFCTFVGFGLIVRAGTVHLEVIVTEMAETMAQAHLRAQSLADRTAIIMGATSGNRVGAEQTTARMVLLTANVEQVRLAAEEAVELADAVAAEGQTSLRVSAAGRQAIEAIIGAMADIRAQVDQIAQDILALSEQTDKIGVITATVNKLADQSNLLALNATIEAARAGEQGKGFKVVAHEVRSLAEQSKQATNQVRAILSHINVATEAAVSATEQGTKRVELGVELAERAGETIMQLTGTINDSAQAGEQIATSAKAQSEGMGRVTVGMHDATEETRAVIGRAEKGFASASASNALARELQEITTDTTTGRTT